MSIRSLAPLLIFALAGCARSAQVPATQSPTANASANPSSNARAAESIALPVEPNGLWWSADEQALYFAGGDQRAVYRRDRAGAMTVAGTFPASDGDDQGGFGQLVVLRDGTIVATRFGGGSAGGVVFLRKDGASGSVPKLDPARRRIGLGLAPDGTLYDTWFFADEKMKSFHGAVARLTLDGSEVDVIADLQKPVGVVVAGARLTVSDQVAQRLVQATLPSLTDAHALVEKLAAPDLLAAGPDGVLFAGSRAGALYRIEPDGRVATLASGMRALRGVAYDAAARKIYFVERGDRRQSLPPILRTLDVN